MVVPKKRSDQPGGRVRRGDSYTLIFLANTTSAKPPNSAADAQAWCAVTAGMRTLVKLVGSMPACLSAIAHSSELPAGCQRTPRRPLPWAWPSATASAGLSNLACVLAARRVVFASAKSSAAGSSSKCGRAGRLKSTLSVASRCRRDGLHGDLGTSNRARLWANRRAKFIGAQRAAIHPKTSSNPGQSAITVSAVWCPPAPGRAGAA